MDSFHKLRRSLFCKIYPISLFILLIHLYANNEELNKLIGTSEKEPISNIEQQNEREISNWKDKFKTKSDNELMNIVNNPGNYTKAPLQAAKALLNERNVL